MELETMKFELRDNGIGILTLNRSKKLNAISFQMEEDFHQVLDHLMVNLDCRVLILRGEGRAFSGRIPPRPGGCRDRSRTRLSCCP